MGCCAGTQVPQNGFDEKRFDALARRYEYRMWLSLSKAAASAGQNTRLRESESTHKDVANASPVVRCEIGRIEDAETSKTIFIFDWDDTLCPTTWARKHWDFRGGSVVTPKLQQERDAALKELSSRVVNVLGAAQRLGKVVLVTNASRPWLTACCDQLMPEAKAILEDMTIVYAMELMNDVDIAEFKKDYLQTESKMRAMRGVVSAFHWAHSSFKGRINVVSIGDATYERDAARCVVRRSPYVKSGSTKCFAKTIKMLHHPSITSISAQLFVIKKWLPIIIGVDHKVDIDLGAPAMELSEYHRRKLMKMECA